jgi:hypothetical protein
MIDPSVKFLLGQLAYQSPTLLVYLAGVLLAILFMPRHRNASILTLLGFGLLLATAIAGIGLQSYIVQQHTDGVMKVEQFAQLSASLGICTNVLRAAGMAMVLAAVFAGRGQSAETRI